MIESHELHDQCLVTARSMRKNQTQAEEMLWAALRGRKLAGLKFQRQHVLGTLIVDFYCAMAKLVVEVDGDIHDYQKEYDSIRTKHLEDYGYHVIRFKNDMVLNDLENVLSQIEIAAFGRISDLTPDRCRDLTPDPSPDSRGGESDTRRGESDPRRGESDTRGGESDTRRGESDPRRGESDTTPDHRP